MRIAMIGGGYVGLVSGACFAEFGTDVTLVEADAQKLGALHAGRMPIYEPGLERLVTENVRAGRLSFTADLPSALKGAEAVFIAVGTPTRRGDGHADLSYVYAAAQQIAQAMTGYAVIVTKSTVPVGTGRRIAEIVRSVRPDLDFDVASNPEFLREGNAIGDFMRPDRVVIGAESDRAREVLRQLYRPLYLIEAPIVFTNIETAELTKYAANAFLAMKVTFINEMADLCERVGADVHDVARGIGLDGRIGRKFLHAGPGYGGSCFPKDTLALVRTALDYGAPSRLVEATVAVNDARKSSMAMRVIKACGGSVRNKTIAVLGLTFKPETDDMRDSPSLSIISRLAGDGAKIRAFDPEGMQQARGLLPEDVTYCRDALDAAAGADALVLITEWNEFRALSPTRLGEAMRGRVLVDLRNVYDPAAMHQAGFEYHCIGRAV
ncbi:MAG: UDP-glucose/GDP-mannose dehydrogenase family protein [Acetobacteraceae bacterium]|nr:UDP-glucose/GDP-mannose dehydrogenase family protein [Acetobacteraceae bacterium]